MKYAEVIYETGAKSIVSIDDSDDSLANFKAGLVEHHRRAINGEPGAPQNVVDRTTLSESDPMYVNPAQFDRPPNVSVYMSRPAERVKRIILYDKHPADLAPVGNDGAQPLSSAAVQGLVEKMADEDGNLNMHQLVAAIRDEVSPVYPNNQGRHESMYKMDGEDMPMDFLNEAADGGESV